MQEDDLDYGSDIQLDDELEAILDQAESQPQAIVPLSTASDEDVIIDIEDAAPRPSPFAEFRKKGWLSVSDLVGTVWCEVQYDYRLRTLPFLPPDKRPNVITSKEGVKISVDKVKVEGKERVMKRGEKIHKRLEREIHPKEIVVHAVTREDVWGLRFLNMFSALEALITLGKCREMPVVGYVKGILVMGIIDEITRKPIVESTGRPNTRSSVPDKSQTSLTAFFPSTNPRAAEMRRERTHRLFVSDSKTRASDSLPNESDTLAGRLQVMLYKELLDALLLPSVDNDLPSHPDSILPTETPFSWNRLFAQLNINSNEAFSESFIVQSRPIIRDNGLRYGIQDAQNLEDMIACWRSYVDALGLGTPSTSSSNSLSPKHAERNTGRTDDKLELVYRRAGAKHRRPKTDLASAKKKLRKEQQSQTKVDNAPVDEVEEHEAFRTAIEASLRDLSESQQVANAVGADFVNGADDVSSDERDFEEEELAWAVEMSLKATATDPIDEGEVDLVVRASQASQEEHPSRVSPHAQSQQLVTSTAAPASQPEVSPAAASSTMVEEGLRSGSGSIIGRTVFSHSPRRLAAHLASVLQWWMGERDAVGVSVEQTKRCGWCEFEANCEWRNRKAEEAMAKFRASKNLS